MGTQGEQANLQSREQMYRMIISQLYYDGYHELASQLSAAVHAFPACPPSDKLAQVLFKGLQIEKEANNQAKQFEASTSAGLDLEFEAEAMNISPEPVLYETCYVTSHKGPCRAVRYHPNGRLVATGSSDASIKILDVERTMAKSSDEMGRDSQQIMETHPVIRTLYDHQDEVTSLDFHPTQTFLISGSRDYSVRFFDYSKPSVKKATKSIQEAFRVTSLSMHPAGDHLLVGTEHPVVRLYDANTFQCFVSNNPSDQHLGPLTAVQWSPNASLFVTASHDGAIKIWDGVSNRAVMNFPRAHDGEVVTSVIFTKNSKYVLSSGRDMLTRLWELSTARCLIAYTGAGATGKAEYGPFACFNHTESYVLLADEKTQSLCSWDARSAERQQLVNLGHAEPVRALAHSPTGPTFVSASDDCRARFWYRRATE